MHGNDAGLIPPGKLPPGLLERLLRAYTDADPSILVGPRIGEDAAVIDGCSRFGSFLRVAVPLTRPGIAVSGILAFIFSWNNFIFAVLLAGPRLQTLPVAIFNVLTFEQINWGPLAAAALLVTAPVLVLAMMVQRHIITGLAAGGLKG
jgi:multiple sugar transport system permease protein